MNENESQIREFIDQLNTDELVNEENLSLDFLRQFKDKIDWKYVFEEKYFYYQYEQVIAQQNLITSQNIGVMPFEEFCKEYNQKFYNQYLKFIL